MTRTAGALIGRRRSSAFWGLGCPKTHHEIKDSLESYSSMSKSYLWACAAKRVELHPLKDDSPFSRRRGS
ncbi:MAG: hypothetical protein ABW170_06840 [Candidatus Thiodiazotropha sp. L084R]